MEPIRVLHVLASLDRGGAETMIMNIYRKINKNIIQFDFVVNKKNDKYSYESEIIEFGGRIYYMPQYKIVNYFSYKRAWTHLLSKHKEWKIIHGHHTSAAVIYLNIANKKKLTTIAHSHTAGGEGNIKSITKILMRYPLRYIATYLFACSGSAGKWMFGNNVSEKDNFFILKNAIDIKNFIYNENVRKRKQEELGVENKFVVGHVGRFQKEKNHKFLIEIFKEIHEKNHNACLLLVGDGELREKMEKKVKNLGLTDFVIFTGVRDDIAELMQAMDVFVFPSLYEGLPVTLIEAQASGLKCLVSDSITDEVGKTNLVEFISLNKSYDYWAEYALKCKLNNYRNMSPEIVIDGYDVRKEVSKLVDFYKNVQCC
jgi:glycosyltransferase involved in cell wall biosynthesis